MRFSILKPFSIDHMREIPKVTMQLQSRLSDAVKRIFDALFAFFALLVLSPFFILIGIAIKRDSLGPVFYRGERIGRRGKCFKILKFRTMYETPESYDGPCVTAEDDCRITPLGAWLRDTKLNELPQFWNVLKGEMSMVGPRPEDPSIAKTWPKGVWDEVLSVCPGITSPTSVQYRNEESLLASGSVMEKYMQELGPDKMRLDQLYVRYRSFWLDLDTILWTGLLLIPRLRTYAPPEKFLYYGPIAQVARRYLSWFTVDYLITLVAISITGVLWRLSEPLDVGWLRSFLLASGFAAVFCVSAALLGVNRISWSRAGPQDAFDLLPAWGLASVAVLLVNHIFHFFPAMLLILSAMVALGGYVVARYRSRVITGLLSYLIRLLGVNRLPRERVLVVGGGPNAQLAAWLMDHPTNADRFQVVGFADDEFLKQGLRTYGAHVLGVIHDVPQLVKKHDIGVILVADHTIPTADYRAIIELQKTNSLRLVILPDILVALNLFSQSVKAKEGNEAEKAEKRFVPCQYCLARKAILIMENYGKGGDRDDQKA
jgi:lipopolysaccharide/colanic/teichoic acid biosynthesis glycosyltransferase